MDELNLQIENLIKNGAKDLTISTNELMKNLLANFDHQTLFKVISNYMNNVSLERREWIICIKVLCSIDKFRANKHFITALNINDADKRFRIIKALDRGCGTEDIVPSLIQLLKNDPDPSIRYMIAKTLGNIGDKRALPALEWSAQNDHGSNHEKQLISDEALASLEKLKINRD